MTFAAKKMPACWLADTNAQITAHAMVGLRAARVGKPAVPVAGLLRYLSLSLPPSRADITTAERDVILESGDVALGVVQHVNMPGWTATAPLGLAHGAAAAGHAALIDYPAGCHVGVDMEGIHNVGQPVLDYLKAWLYQVHSAGYLAVVYWGYAFLVAPESVVALLAPGDVFWTDYGEHAPPSPGFLLHQHAQSMVGGTLVDLDEDTGVDGRGNALVLMVRLVDANVETSEGADDRTQPMIIPIPADAVRDTQPPPTEPNP